jgi:hypothetical protein
MRDVLTFTAANGRTGNRGPPKKTDGIVLLSQLHDSLIHRLFGEAQSRRSARKAPIHTKPRSDKAFVQSVATATIRQGAGGRRIAPARPAGLTALA